MSRSIATSIVGHSSVRGISSPFGYEGETVARLSSGQKEYLLEPLYDGGYDGFWYDFKDPELSFKDTADTSTPVSRDGDGVSYVLDKSGNGHHLSQPTIGKRPRYTIGGSQTFAEFSSSGYFLTSEAFDWGSDEVTLVVAARFYNNSTLCTICEWGPSVAVTDGAFDIMAPDLSNKIQFRSRGDGSEAKAATTNAAYGSSSPWVMSGLGKISAPSATLRVNGNQLAQITTTQGAGNYANTQFFVGMRGGVEFPILMRLYGIFAINRLLDAEELALVEAWAASIGYVTL